MYIDGASHLTILSFRCHKVADLAIWNCIAGKKSGASCHIAVAETIVVIWVVKPNIFWSGLKV